jgi:NOL1/NOP2/fmu family ribosome biogenesis protein
MLLLFVVVVLGCSHPVKMARPGMTLDQWDRDYYECTTAANLAIDWNAGSRTATANAIANGSEHRKQFESCVESRGYRRVSVEEYERILVE